MRIVLSSSRPNVDGDIDPRFGRCRYFLFVDPHTLQYEVEENPHVEAASGAGISAAQFVVNKGAQAVITGNIGPNAHQVLTAAGIQMFTGVSGKIRDVVEVYKTGDLKSSSQPTGGMGMGRGMGQGCGTGRGAGMGRGMGCGRGMGMGQAAWAGAGGERETPAQSPGSTDEIALLRHQADALGEELVKIKERIRQLESR